VPVAQHYTLNWRWKRLRHSYKLVQLVDHVVGVMLQSKFLMPKAVTIPVALCLALSACAASDSSTYSRGDVGQVIETSQGQVISSRPVDIRDSEGGRVGAVAGGAAGGVVGSTIGKGSGNTLATLGGVLIGAGLGYLAEREIRSDEGVEYLVEMDDGRVVTIVQNQKDGDQAIPDGTPVLIQYGNEYTRLVPLQASPSAGGATPGSDEWRNPDRAPTYDPNATSDPGPTVQTQTTVPIQ
jgi:outer membrane lipoprotein SlyB